MKNLKFTLLMTLMLVCGIGVIAQQEKYSKVKFYTADKALKNELLGLLEIDHFQESNGGIISVINASDIKKLAARKVKYEVMVDDVVANLERENQKYFEALKSGVDPNEYNRGAYSQVGRTVSDIIQRPTAFTVWTGSPNFGGYYTLAQMNTAITNLTTTYPTLAQRITLGNSIEGRPIWAVKISDNVATDETGEPEILYIGLQHAREAIGGSSMIFFMQYLCQFYATDDRVRDLVNNREIYIIPCMNPDGYERNRRTNSNGGGQQRKNRRKNSDSTNSGVDLNRNWGVDWGNCPVPAGSCGSGTASSSIYWGTGAFSEPETRAVRDFVYTRQFVAMIDQHAFGPYYSLPFGRPALHTMSADDAKFFTHVPAAMGYYNGMRAGNSPQAVGYEVAGGVKDWMLMGNIGTGTKGKIYGLTGEGGAADNDFWPPASAIEQLCKGMVYQNLQYAYAAGSYVDIQDLGSMTMTNKWGGNFDFEITRIGLANEPVTISLIPIENIVSVGTPVTVNSLPNYEDKYTGSISYSLPWTIQNGHRVKYAWRVETGGYLYYDTVIKFLNPTLAFSDNMEGSVTTNWTRSSVALNLPGDTVHRDNNWNTTTSQAYTGSRSLTESPNGNYGHEETRTLTYNGTLNLTSSTQSYICFYTKYRCENFYDKLQVHASTNNFGTVAGTVRLVGTNTVQEPGTWDGSTINGQPSLTGWREGWTKQVFDLNGFNGQNNVRIRLQFTSSDVSGFFYGTDDGFYIDNFQVITSSMPLQILPVRFLDLRGKLLPNRTIEVTWDAETDAQHSYFEVEKSADGANFRAIGKVTTVGPPYKFIDMSPFTGNNYYRIKQYDKDGHFNYSVVVNVKNIYKGGVLVYPNPLGEGDVLTIKPEARVSEPVNVRITDAQGRVIFHKFIHDWQSSGEIKINTSSWKPQIYVLKVTNSRGEFITVEKIVKN